jgi:hypothetical protein
VADRVQLLRPVHRDDGDIVVGFVQDQVVGHGAFPPDGGFSVRQSESAGQPAGAASALPKE